MHRPDNTAPEILPNTTSDYVRTHCTICAAGWTRTNTEGHQAVVCLLDRSPVWPLMVTCARYEPREIPEPPRT